MKKENVLLIGNFGAGNLGDESILMAALDVYQNAKVMTANPDISRQFCGQDFDVVPFFPTGIRSYFRYFFSVSYRMKLRSECNEITKVIFAGGGLFALRFKAYWIWWQMARWAQKLCPKAEIVWESQGIDETHGALKHWMMRKAFSGAKYLSVRDELSLRSAQKLYSKKIHNVGDRVDKFLSVQDFSRLVQKHNANLVLINARAKISDALAQKISDMYPDHMIGFVAFAPSDVQYCPNVATVCAYPTNYNELCALIASADIFIGERLHSLVYGYRILGNKKVRLLREPYSQKVSSYSEAFKIRLFTV